MATLTSAVLFGAVTFVACLLDGLLHRAPTISLAAPTLWAFGCGLPISAGFSLAMRQRTRQAIALRDEQQHRIDAVARRRDFESTLADALEMSDSEPEALLVIEQAFSAVLPDQPTELLLADNSHARLSRMAFTAPDGTAPGCGVSSPNECPAARRARVHRFPDSDAINACPKLKGRPIGRCSALCLPVAVMGRTVGVIHTVGLPGSLPEAELITDLEMVASQAGTRLGLLRVMAETQLQATTDALTGLLNRRAFETNFLRMRGQADIAAVAMADLDHFKKLNDTHGHEVGDRALRAFADILRSVLRAEDLISRRGGEEFAIFFPGSNAGGALVALQRVQAHLRASPRVSGLPSYTASFGIVDIDADEDLGMALSRADAALFAAKHAGRDRVVVHDRYGEEKLYPATALPVTGEEATPEELPTHRAR